MTPQEARKLVRRECKRRKRTWGAENEQRLRAMRLEVRLLKEMPIRWAKRVSDTLHGKRHLGNGGYTGRHPSLSKREDA